MKVGKIAVIILAVLASVAVALIPWTQGLAPRVAAAILILSVVLWVSEAIPLYVTGLLILVLEVVWLSPIIREAKPAFKDAAFFSPYFSDIIALFLGGMILAEGISRYNLDTLLTRRVVMWAGGRPRMVLLALMLTVGFISMWISNTAATALGVILVHSLTRKLPENSRFGTAFYLGIPFAANFGGIGTPVGTPPNAIALGFLHKAGITDISFVDWLIALGPFALLLVFITWIVLILLFKAPEGKLEMGDGKAEPISRSGIVVLAVFLLTATLWLTSGLHGIPDGIVALVPAIIFLGFGLLNVKDFKGISWDVLFLVGGGMSLSVALTQSGLGDVIASAIPTGNISLPVLMLLFAFIGLALSNVMSNTATANILIPLAFLVQGVEYVPLVLASVIAVSSAMVLPISTPPNALAYSSGKIPLKYMILTGGIMGIISVAIFFVLGVPWLRFLKLF